MGKGFFPHHLVLDDRIGVGVVITKTGKQGFIFMEARLAAPGPQYIICQMHVVLIIPVSSWAPLRHQSRVLAAAFQPPIAMTLNCRSTIDV